MRATIGNTCFLVLLLATTVWGQQYVIKVPGDCSSIQGALNQASGLIDGTTPGNVLIEVGPGTYIESLDLNNIDSNVFRVTLHALEGQSRTTIDSSTLGQGMHSFRGAGIRNFTLDGFTVRNRYDPMVVCCPRGMHLTDSTHITVQNSFFDTTHRAMEFPITNPKLSSEVTVVHNTVIGGNGTDPTAEDFLTGQAVSMEYSSNDPNASPPIGDNKLIVADNVFRCNGSAVRYLMNLTNEAGNATIGTFPNGTVVMTGNDVSNIYGAGHNIFGGHSHIIAGNRFHDSTIGSGGQIVGSSGGIIENNLYINNGVGLNIHDLPVVTESAHGNLLVRHNTVVNNVGAGIAYSSERTDGIYKGVPIIYNNIVAYNNASGIAAVLTTPDSISFIPIDFHLERNNVFGNTLKNLTLPNDWFSFEGISNPQMATKNYAGAINTRLDLSILPLFVNVISRDYSLINFSPMRNRGTTNRPFPSKDFAGTLRDSAPDIGAFEFFKIPK